MKIEWTKCKNEIHKYIIFNRSFISPIYEKRSWLIKNKLDDIKVYESEEREKNSNFSFKSQIKKIKIKGNPNLNIETPKIGINLPTTLTVEEIDQIILNHILNNTEHIFRNLNISFMIGNNLSYEFFKWLFRKYQRISHLLIFFNILDSNGT